MPAVKLMTNLLPDLYAYVKEEARAQKKSMRAIIEEAILVYRKEKKKARIIKDCERLAEDKEYLEEMVETAELGMEYYLQDIDGAYIA